MHHKVNVFIFFQMPKPSVSKTNCDIALENNVYNKKDSVCP